MATNVRGTELHQQTVQEQGLGLHPHMDQPTEVSSSEHLQENVTWKQPSECHDILCFVCIQAASMPVP